jgi:hypothetical protein
MFWISFPQRHGELRRDLGICQCRIRRIHAYFLNATPGAEGTLIATLYPVLKRQILFSVAKISQPKPLQAVKNGALNSERGVQMKKFLLEALRPLRSASALLLSLRIWAFDRRPPCGPSAGPAAIWARLGRGNNNGCSTTVASSFGRSSHASFRSMARALPPASRMLTALV